MSMAEFQSQYMAQDPWLWLGLLVLLSLLVGVQIGKWLAGARYRRLLDEASSSEAVKPGSVETDNKAAASDVASFESADVEDQDKPALVSTPPPISVPVKKRPPEDEAVQSSVQDAQLDNQFQSIAPALIGDLVGITDKQVAKLSAHGVQSIEQLLDATQTRTAREELADALQLEDFVVTKWQRMAEFLQLPNMTPQAAEFLVFAGISSIADMAQRNPESMHHKMQNLNEKEQRVDQVPSRVQLEQWIAHNANS